MLDKPKAFLSSTLTFAHNHHLDSLALLLTTFTAFPYFTKALEYVSFHAMRAAATTMPVIVPSLTPVYLLAAAVVTQAVGLNHLDGKDTVALKEKNLSPVTKFTTQTLFSLERYVVATVSGGLPVTIAAALATPLGATTMVCLGIAFAATSHVLANKYVFQGGLGLDSFTINFAGKLDSLFAKVNDALAYAAHNPTQERAM